MDTILVILLAGNFIEILILIFLYILLIKKKRDKKVKLVPEKVQSKRTEQKKEIIKGKPKREGFFLWLKKKIKSWKKRREKAKQEKLKRDEEEKRQEILDEKKEERERIKEEERNLKEQIISEKQEKLRLQREKLQEQREEKRKERERVKEIKKTIKEKIPETSVEKKHIGIPNFIKLLIVLIPLILIGYVVYTNFLASHDFNSLYDIGSSEDAKKSYLSPANRISDISNSSETETYRNLTSGLVYFNVPIPTGSNKINVEVKFKDNFPSGTSISIGAKDKEEWHYSYKNIYNPMLDNLKEFDYSGTLTRFYRINNNLPLVDDISKIPDNSIVASNLNLKPILNNQDYDIKPLIVSTGLRGGHIFYIYLKDSLDLKVKKQDLNWYDNADEMTINLYDLDGNLIANTTILDDGITIVDKAIAKIQEGQLTVGNLSKGVYKLEFTNFDGLIREFSLNTNKIITN